MKIYRVGGFVRDTLLNRTPKDIDYVVVGSTPTEMLSLGYEQVGKDFPVFLHPDTQDEYALARTETSTGPGYNDFVTEFAPTVTLEEDLSRRDLTINAMAMDANDTVIDPYNGQTDLNNGIIRHTSVAFTDDPVRALRVARFKARYEFTVAPETVRLIQKMKADGMFDNFITERVYTEIVKGMNENKPWIMLEFLRAECIVDFINNISSENFNKAIMKLKQAVHLKVADRMIVFFYFSGMTQDELKENGFSKYIFKTINQVQILNKPIRTESKVIYNNIKNAGFIQSNVISSSFFSILNVIVDEVYANQMHNIFNTVQSVKFNKKDFVGLTPRETKTFVDDTYITALNNL